MAPRDYRESWAWVHYLLNHSSATKTALLGYLADLRADPQTRRISERLKATEAGVPERLLAHIEKVRTLPATAPPAVATPTPPAADPTIRLQDNAIELARTAPPRRNMLERIRSLFGLD